MIHTLNKAQKVQTMACLEILKKEAGFLKLKEALKSCYAAEKDWKTAVQMDQYDDNRCAQVWTIMKAFSTNADKATAALKRRFNHNLRKQGWYEKEKHAAAVSDLFLSFIFDPLNLR